jgi:hypothetical protein
VWERERNCGTERERKEKSVMVNIIVSSPAHIILSGFVLDYA